MTLDGPTGFVLMGVAAVLFFCAVIGSVVWMYSRQSAKRRTVQAEAKGTGRRNG